MGARLCIRICTKTIHHSRQSTICWRRMIQTQQVIYLIILVPISVSLKCVLSTIQISRFLPFNTMNSLLTTDGVVCCIKKPTLCPLDVASYLSVSFSQCACAHTFVVGALSVITRRCDEHSALDALDKKSYIVTDSAAPCGTLTRQLLTLAVVSLP